MTKNTLTYLYNKAWKEIEDKKLQMELQKLLELIRNNNIVNSINQQKNVIQKLYNDQLNTREIMKLNETLRSNLAKELETNRHNLRTEEIDRLEAVIKQFEAQTGRINAETNARNASTSEKRLVTDLIGSAIKGAGTAALSKMVLDRASKSSLQTMVNTVSHPEVIATTFSGALSKAGSALGNLGSTLLKGAPIAMLLTATATNLTGSTDKEMMKWRASYGDRSKRDVEQDEIAEEVTVNGKTSKLPKDFSPLKTKFLNGGSSNENVTKSPQINETGGNSSPGFSPKGPGDNVKSENDGNRGGSKVIDTRSSYGPGVAFS